MAKKISDELRNWFSIDHCGSGLLVSNSECDRLLALADRIDSEMVEIPKDADGREVPLDTKELYDANGKRVPITSFTFSCGTNGCWSDWKAFSPDASSDGGMFYVDGMYLTMPDSLERIADELDEQAGSLTKDGYTWQEDAIHDFADRIRKLAAKEDEHEQD